MTNTLYTCTEVECTEEISSAAFKRSGLCLRHRRNRNMSGYRAEGRVNTRVDNPMPLSERGKLHAGKSLGRTTPVSYVAAHSRVKAAYGPAAEHDCIGCGGQAREWAYQGGDPAEQQGWHRPTEKDYWVRWSSNPEFYSAMCYQCHRALDSQSDAKPALLTHIIKTLPEDQLRTILDSYNGSDQLENEGAR